MARKPIAQVRQYVMVEGIDEPVEVLDVALTSIVSPQMLQGKRTGKHPYSGYAYRCKVGREKRWYYQFEIEYVFTYKPVMLEPSRHAELAGTLGGYEALRDYVETLPRTTRNSFTVRELARLLEYCALLAEGTSQECTNAEAEIISIMQ